MIITTRFEVDAPLELVWRHLLDVPKIAPCVPGAQLTEVIDERTYSGKIQVKLGPITVDYKGRIHIEEIDEVTHSVQLKADGVESKGRGGAVATVKGKLHEEAGRTVATMESEVAVSGLVAQFGRSAIMQDVAQRLAQQFASCFEQDLKAAATTATPAAADAPAARKAEPAAPAARAKTKPVSAFALLWAVLRDRLRSLFRRR